MSASEAGPERLDLVVAAMISVSRTRAATLIATGRVTVNGKHEKAAYRVEPEDVVKVDVPELVQRDVVGEDIP
ncbi:MAG TPA: S4 domain-containing protein, partial [Gemmatimonadaceae bacterium]|nr:S4 domain-containing protein [Gemmatimonadaceae bacterium]